MAVVSLKIGSRFYKFSCNDGQEVHMKELADMLDKKADQLTKSLGFMQEGQLLAMICLLLAEEKCQIEKQSPYAETTQDADKIAQTIRDLADKITTLTNSLNV